MGQGGPRKNPCIGPRSTEMGKHGTIWEEIDEGEPQLTELDQDQLRGKQIDQDSPKKTKMESKSSSYN